MSTMSSQPPQSPSQSQLIANRWARIRTGAQLAAAARRASSEPRPLRPRKPSTVNWRRYLTLTAALVGVGLMGNLALAWLHAPTAKDVRSGAELFAHQWVPNISICNLLIIKRICLIFNHKIPDMGQC